MAQDEPRFTGENFTRNLAIVDEVRAIGAENGATPAQTALAWLLTRGTTSHPSPAPAQSPASKKIPQPTSPPSPPPNSNDWITSPPPQANTTTKPTRQASTNSARPE